MLGFFCPKYIIPALTLILVLNVELAQSTAVGVVFGLLYVGYLGWRAGSTFESDNTYTRAVLGSLVVLLLILLLGSISFYVWELSALQLTLITIAVAVIISFAKKHDSQDSAICLNKQTFRTMVLGALYIACAVSCFSILTGHTTMDAIQGPWQIVPSTFFVYYFFAVFLLGYFLLIASDRSNPILILPLLSIHLLLTYSVAVIVYQLNFGFDPFIHQATEKLLLATGTISPKPLLYMGHYSVVVWISELFNISVTLVDKLLVPVLAAIYIPTAIYHGLKNSFSFKSSTVYLATALFPALLLPFFFSVPQNFANLLVLLTVLISLPYLFNTITYQHHHRVILWVMTAAVLLTHPLSGIPLAIYIVFFEFYKIKRLHTLNPSLRKTILAILIIGAIAALPAVLMLSGTNSQETLSTLAESNSNGFGDIVEWIPFYSIFHLVYFFKTNLWLLLGITALVSAYSLVKKKKNITPLMIVFVVLIANILLIRNTALPIIAYEIPEFVNRFWQIGLLFLSPILLFGFARMIESSTNKETKIVRTIPIVLFIALVSSMSMYLLYPREDAFAKSRAFATSQQDIEAVKWIEQDAQGQAYVVLSNQAVAAAALHEFGFAKYYHDTLFYYPIPTTSPLYALYLDMVYIEPTKNRLEQAIELTGADTAYFVINDYWLDAEKRVEQASELISEPYIIGDENVYIFKLNTLSNNEI